MKTLITSMALAMLIAVTANAEIIHFNDFESSGTNQGTGFGIAPDSMDNTSGGGDHVGPAAQGLSSANTASGAFAYAVDLGDTADNGNGWGATWSTMQSNSGNTSGGFTTEADAVANGGKYIDYAVGTVFTASAQIATDAVDALTGGGSGHVRFEFLVDGAEFNQADRAFSNILDISNISDTYSLATLTYTIDATDVANGINGVNVGLGTDGSGFGAADGLIYFDDLLFEVSDANVFTVTAAVPEPGSAGLLLAGLMGLLGVRRRKS